MDGLDGAAPYAETEESIMPLVVTSATPRASPLGAIRLSNPPAKAPEGCCLMATRQEIAVASMAHAKALEPLIRKLVVEGITGTTHIARALNDAGYPAIRGGLWTSAQVGILLHRLELR
ncbi:hypothetical protein QWZ14_30165 [Paeniroseomonas aquatica]|uniref:Recombinase domain-containing protein n=1 Tax=Paeniroseomonas aquatica TaxID=373043 RepID=A0ABT8AGJ9_9PROT|nr:hypothetical protein [Paeniroseomonas aquatica]MDN3568661.1 hypothetical protein [Paeniroseomonas aquatica]